MKVLLPLFISFAAFSADWKCKVMDHSGQHVISNVTIYNQASRADAIQKCFDTYRRDCICRKK